MSTLVNAEMITDLFGCFLEGHGFRVVATNSVGYELSVSFENDRKGITVFVEQGSSTWVSIYDPSNRALSADLKFVCWAVCGDDVKDLISRYGGLDVPSQLRNNLDDLKRCLPQLLKGSDDLLVKASLEARRYNS